MAPSTTQTHPDVTGCAEDPPEAGGAAAFEAGEGATDDAGATGDARVEVGKPQVPNADWHPAPQYSTEFPK